MNKLHFEILLQYETVILNCKYIRVFLIKKNAAVVRLLLKHRKKKSYYNIKILNLIGNFVFWALLEMSYISYFKV